MHSYSDFVTLSCKWSAERSDCILIKTIVDQSQHPVMLEVVLDPSDSSLSHKAVSQCMQDTPESLCKSDCDLKSECSKHMHYLTLL